MDPFFHTGLSISDSLKTVRKSVLIYETIIMTANLSGGNQQKVVLGKWLSASGDIMIFDEPTKGIDVGAKAEIYALMEELLEQGKSIIMVSSELTEVMGMSDRIYVMKDGKITAEIDRNEFNEQMILTCALEENEV